MKWSPTVFFQFSNDLSNLSLNSVFEQGSSAEVTVTPLYRSVWPTKTDIVLKFNPKVMENLHFEHKLNADRFFISKDANIEWIHGNKKTEC